MIPVTNTTTTTPQATDSTKPSDFSSGGVTTYDPCANAMNNQLSTFTNTLINNINSGLGLPSLVNPCSTPTTSGSGLDLSGLGINLGPGLALPGGLSGLGSGLTIG